MAEIVGVRQERMLPEYELMKKKQIFDDEQLRTIMKTREKFEYKISRQGRTMKDYIHYITHERKVLKLISEKERSRDQKMTSLEYSIANHIKILYKEALSMFPQDPRLWDNFIIFCKASKYNSEISTAFEKMLQYHGDKSEIWLRAAMWEYHETNNFDRVKDLFFRGLQRHPDNSKLYVQFFRIMLTEAAKMSTEKILENGTESEQSLGVERVLLVFKSAMKKIRNLDFLVELLTISEEFIFTKYVQKVIIDHMMQSFPRDEIAWHVLAQRELKGLHTCDLQINPLNIPDIPDEVDDNEDEGQNNTETETKLDNGFSKKTPKRKIQLCYSVYEAAVKEIQSEKMWSLFLNAMLELNHDSSTQQVTKRKKLGAAFKSAHEANRMSEEHYIAYVNLLSDSNAEEDYFLEIVNKATTLHAKSVKLWELWMYHHILQNDAPKVYEVFCNANKKLGPASYPLWRLILQFYQTRYDLLDKLEETFSDACKQTAPAFGSFRGQYLEWLAINKGLNDTRYLYKALTKLSPPCYELHKKMALLESQAIKPNIEKWRNCHENATLFFGKKRTDVWIDFIKFEREHGEAKNMTFLYERAKATLDLDLVDNFISEHCLLTTGMV